MDLFHLLLGRSIVLFTLICAIWGLLAHWHRAPDDSRYYSTLILAEALLILQALLGTAVLLSGRMPRDPLHLAYGGLAAIVLPAVYGFAQRQGWRLALPTGLAMLFIWGLTIRAFTTAPGGFAALLGATGR